jgi:hypothetical protein
MGRYQPPILTYQARPQAPVTIYALRDPRTRQVRYIGKALDPRGRLRQHISAARLKRCNSKKNGWLKGLLADGHYPILDILAVVPGPEADRTERAWIARHRALGSPLTNATAGGGGRPNGRPGTRKPAKPSTKRKRTGGPIREAMSTPKRKPRFVG